MQKFQESREREALQRELISLFGEEVMASCEAPSATVGGAMTSRSESQGYLILEKGTNHAHDWYTLQSEETKPASASELTAIICADGEREGERETIETCRYIGTSDTVLRYRYDPQVLVLDPTTLETVAMTTLEGKNPSRCPQSISSNSTSSAHHGGLPEVDALINWLQSQGY